MARPVVVDPGGTPGERQGKARTGAQEVVMSDDENPLLGWDEIGSKFMLSGQSIQKKYGKEMLRDGWALKSRGSKKVFAWPSQVKKFQAKKQIEQGFV